MLGEVSTDFGLLNTKRQVEELENIETDCVDTVGFNVTSNQTDTEKVFFGDTRYIVIISNELSATLMIFALHYRFQFDTACTIV